MWNVFLSSFNVVLIRHRQTFSQEAFMSLTKSLNERFVLLDFEIFTGIKSNFYSTEGYVRLSSALTAHLTSFVLAYNYARKCKLFSEDATWAVRV
jgi:hypothetical protein